MSARPTLLAAAAIEAGSLFAHAVNTVKMAEGFARNGLNVVFVCLEPAGGPVSPERLNALYGLNAPLDWVMLPANADGTPRGDGMGFAVPALELARAREARIVYARSYVLPALTAREGIPTLVEAHTDPSNARPDFADLLAATHLPGLRRLVTIAPVLARGYAARGAAADRIVVLPDAVDERLFARPAVPPPSPLGPGPNAVYAGHLYDYKGIPAILEAAALRPGIRFHLVGGWPQDVERTRARVEAAGLTNVTLHGLCAHAEIPPFLWGADVALLPPSATHPSAAWTSPMKLGEYMMARVPVVATGIPALRHWLSGREAVFCEPDDGAALARAIDEAIAPGAARDGRVAAAHRLVERWTFTRRAATLLEACAA